MSESSTPRYRAGDDALLADQLDRMRAQRVELEASKAELVEQLARATDVAVDRAVALDERDRELSQLRGAAVFLVGTIRDEVHANGRQSLPLAVRDAAVELGLALPADLLAPGGR